MRKVIAIQFSTLMKAAVPKRRTFRDSLATKEDKLTLIISDKTPLREFAFTYI